ncbi:MAG: hypothetical protein RR075_04375, partial [Pygmaiobacter sp.]
MSLYSFRLARLSDKDAMLQFMNTHWGSRHPLMNLPDYFTYYYQNGDPSCTALNFALCLNETGDIAALCGFIPSCADGSDIWVSIWCANKKEKGSGLELMDKLPKLTGAKLLSCNNIRSNTIPFYEFLGYTGARMRHWYRLALREQFAVAVPKSRERQPIAGDGYF